jgi:phospholipid/cholesterol/gamma-HCH transport system substrate-binding protein
MTRSALTKIAAAALIVLIALGSAFLTTRALFPKTTITALFTSATGIYPGDQVRIAGVEVGTITAIQPDGSRATMTLEVAHGVRVPADAKAIVVAQNLVSARFVQLAPAYTSGPLLSDGSVIGVERTAVPVEWDEVKEQLSRLATDLGPAATAPTSSAGRFIDSAANAMAGNGAKLRQTLKQLAGISRVIADGSGDISQIITNLQTFVAVLRDSNQQIIQFENRLATLSSVLDGSRSDIDDALTNLAAAIVDVQRFVAGTRDKTSEQVQRLVNVTQNLVDHRADLEQLLHVAPSAIANSYNMMDPRTGGASGVFIFNNMSNPTMFFCGMIAAVANVTAPETGELCEKSLGPGLDQLNFNYLPFPLNPLLTSVPSAGKLIYSEPHLMPGAAGDTTAPIGLAPQSSAYQDAPSPTTLPDMLLPAERPPS